MGKQKIAVITGIRGQDASYLSEFLLDKGYKVIGVGRRTSNPNNTNIAHLFDHPNFEVISGDVSDAASMSEIVNKHKPDEFYNLAAQSFVAASWSEPVATFQTNAVGVINCLEAIRQFSPDTRFYQASTSERFGQVLETPQTETTPTNPLSPYAAAKCAGEDIVKVYRESYNLYACFGILMNHECFDANTPLIIKNNNYIDVIYIRDLAPERIDMSKDNNVISVDVEDTKIWNGSSFVDINMVTRRKIKTLHRDNQKKVLYNTRRGAVKTTPNHKLLQNKDFRNIDEIKKDARDFKIGEEILHGDFPKTKDICILTKEEARLLGMIVGDGYVSNNSIRLSNIDDSIIEEFIHLCRRVFGSIKYSIVSENPGAYGRSQYVEINGLGQDICRALRLQLYHTKTKHKKVPSRVLNSCKEVKEEFFRGYYLCDGLKKYNVKHEFKSLKSNSPILCQGLLLLLNDITGQTFNINAFEQNSKEYYQINLHSPDSNKGTLKNPVELKKNSVEDYNLDCYVYDIETSCGYLNAGVGSMVVGNSSRRGLEFVTRKITHYVGSMYQTVKNNETKILSMSNKSHMSFRDLCEKALELGIVDQLALGNLEAQRDWSSAEDMVKGMWLMLNQDNPKDYLLSSGTTRSIKDFLDEAFSNVNVNWNNFVRIDPKFYRPAEVDLLLGDCSKAQKELGWEQEISFSDLVKSMVRNDCGENPEPYIKRLNEIVYKQKVTNA